MSKYINTEGKVGVLVSPRFGTGWSTLSSNREFFCMDRKLVAMKLANTPEDEIKQYIEEATGEHQYMGGWEDTIVEWLDIGTRFTIEEYYGSESLRLISDLSMTA